MPNIQSAITNLVQSEQQFPVSFEQLWAWCGYSHKHKAKTLLVSNFERNLDFTTNELKTPSGGRPSEIIHLTIDAAKQFALLAQTTKGKEIRKYFIYAEQQWRKQLSTPQTYIEALKALVIAEEEKERLTTENNKLKETVDELFSYSSIIRIAKYNKVSEKSFNWRTLKPATLRLGLTIKVAPCPRFGTKNLYPHQAWQECYPGIKLPEAELYLPSDQAYIAQVKQLELEL